MLPKRPPRRNPKNIPAHVFWPVSPLVAHLTSLLHANLHGLVWSFQKQFRPCIMAQATMAKELGISKRTVQKLADDLEEAGLMEVIPRFRPNGSQQSSQYIALIPPTPDRGE